MTRFGGLVVRRECWTLSTRGRVVTLGLAVALIVAAVLGAYPFLAVTRAIQGTVLVVEGWVPTYTLEQAADEFKHGHYQKVLVVRPYDVDKSKSAAVLAKLVDCGILPADLDVVYHPVVRKDRTYNMALSVKEWLSEHEMSSVPMNVATLGPHARRSRLMFEKAFGSTAPIGIIALEDLTYDSKRWWRTSEGVREVLGETIAYVYAKFFFVWN